MEDYGIGDRLKRFEDDLKSRCLECGRGENDVTLIGVSKVFPVEYAKAAYNAGLRDFGENRVQEFVPKTEEFSDCGYSDARWHLIGTLQKNKVKYIVGKTYLIHSVDSAELAAEISKRSVCNNVTSDILLQVNVSGEESKHGFAPEMLPDISAQIAEMPGVNVRGIMTMAPIQKEEGDAGKVFGNTRKLFENCSYGKWDILSMGMSGDWKYAVAEGATHIRIGTAIFGDRAAYTASV